MARPLIGITTYLEQAVQGVWDERFAMVPETYLLAVEEAGGTPILLPPQPVDPDAIARVLGAVDGLVLSGGADVDPELYGAERGPHTQTPRRDRDAWEIALVVAALDRGLPVLAICRGVQLLNVALGGTLTQHVPDITDADHGDAPGAYSRTDVDIEDWTRVRDVLGERLTVHCHHHQVIDRVAEGLLVAAHSADGLVEAVELPGAAFVVGVQWHPEQDASDRRLFIALVEAAISASASASASAPASASAAAAAPAPAPASAPAFSPAGRGASAASLETTPTTSSTRSIDA